MFNSIFSHTNFYQLCFLSGPQIDLVWLVILRHSIATYSQLWNNNPMTTSQLTTSTIADFIEWNKKKQLILNPEFQRRNVWTLPAKIFLIDTILRELSLPKFYIRTKLDLSTQKSIREVVDGQQRLTAILEFADDKFVLSSRAGEFKGFKYSTLPTELQENFLKYQLAVELLTNASDTEVLEVFSRLNNYGLVLNSAEKRHAEFQGSFKWAVRNKSKEYSSLWNSYKIISIQQRLRMADDSTIAELYGILLEGVQTGGEGYLNKIYKRYDADIPNQKEIELKLDSVIRVMNESFSDVLQGGLGRRPNFIMFFAAVAHSLFGLPQGALDYLPAVKPIKIDDNSSLSLGRLNDVLLDSDGISGAGDLTKFKYAASNTTQNIKSRNVRFIAIYSAITE